MNDMTRRDFVKIAGGATAALGGALGLAGCQGSAISQASGDDSSDGDTIKIGILYSTTGDFSISETPMQNAAKMAVDEINAAGGINGKQIETVVTDYGSDPSLASQKAQEMILENGVCAIVGTNSSATREAVLPTIEQNNSLLVYNTFYEGGTPSPNCLYTNTCPNQQIKDFIPYICENMGNRIFFVGSDYEFPHTALAYAKKILEEEGGELLGEEYMPTDATDYSSVINKIKTAAPDAVFSAVAGNASVPFYKQYSQYGMDPKEVPICSISAHEGTVKGIGEPAVGTYSSFEYFNSIDSDESQTFIENYADAFGTDTTVSNSAEAAYHGTYMLARAIEKAGSTNTDDIIAAAAGLEWDTPAGHLKMHESNHHAYLYSYIGRVTDDLTFEIVRQSDGLIEPDPEA
ncbi:transporter substrate-binding protein [Thermophilibacter sp.]